MLDFAKSEAEAGAENISSERGKVAAAAAASIKNELGVQLIALIINCVLPFELCRALRTTIIIVILIFMATPKRCTQGAANYLLRNKILLQCLGLIVDQ